MKLKGRIGGTIPFDFQSPSIRREFRSWWNPESDEILVPRSFGIGWAVNLSALKRRYPLMFWALAAFAALALLAQWRSGRDS